jgi:hypothetical protein
VAVDKSSDLLSLHRPNKREKNEPCLAAAAFSAAVHVQRSLFGTPFIT